MSPISSKSVNDNSCFEYLNGYIEVFINEVEKKQKQRRVGN